MLAQIAVASGATFLATGAWAVEQVTHDSGTTITALSLFVGALASLIVAVTALIKLLRPTPPSAAELLALEILRQRAEEETRED